MYEDIKMLICDVDGVLTKQDLLFNGTGISPYRVFCAKDGSACTAALIKGLKIAWISGRDSEAVKARAKSLKISDIYLGSVNKYQSFLDLMERYNLKYDNLCFITDDFLDLPVFIKVGLACAVSDADADIKRHAHYITSRRGGEGAVADVIRLILTDRFGANAFEEIANVIWSQEENLPG